MIDQIEPGLELRLQTEPIPTQSLVFRGATRFSEVGQKLVK